MALTLAKVGQQWDDAEVTRSRQLAVVVGALFVTVSGVCWLAVDEPLPAVVALAAALLLVPASAG